MQLRGVGEGVVVSVGVAACNCAVWARAGCMQRRGVGEGVGMDVGMAAGNSAAWTSVGVGIAGGSHWRGAGNRGSGFWLLIF